MSKISKSLLKEIQECKKCETIIGHKKFPIGSHGQLNSRFLLVSEAPGKASLYKNKYWTGAGGNLLRAILKEVGIELEEYFYLTDIVKCWPNDNNKNRKPKQAEVSNCKHFLWKEIDQLNPKIIIALGKTVADKLLDEKILMRDAHGKTFKVQGRDVLVLYHPSNINYSMSVVDYKNQLREIFTNLLSNK